MGIPHVLPLVESGGGEEGGGTQLDIMFKMRRSGEK